MKKVFGSFVLWHVSGILKYGVHVWLAWVSLAKLVIFSVSALTIWRPDFLAEFAQLLKVAELSSPLPARKLWPSALQWFHRGSLAFFCFAHLPCELHQPMSTISILQMNETHNDIVFLSWRWIGPRCFSCMFFFGKKGSFWASCWKNKKANLDCIFVWCSNLHFSESSGLGGRCWVPRFNHGTHDVSPRCQWKNDGDW